MGWLKRKIEKIVIALAEQGKVEICKCPTCGGSGVTHKCQDCNGKGIIGGAKEDCGLCQGSGLIENTAVVGNKYDGNYMVIGSEVETTNSRCSCYVEPATCHSCQGTGKKEGQCQNCKGTGLSGKLILKGSQ